MLSKMLNNVWDLTEKQILMNSEELDCLEYSILKIISTLMREINIGSIFLKRLFKTIILLIICLQFDF